MQRAQLGDSIVLAVWCRDSNDTPTLPETAPTAEIYSDSEHVLDRKMPIRDRYSVVAYFAERFFLDSRFSAGLHHVIYRYTLGSDNYAVEDTFEILPGGDAVGGGISLYHFKHPLSEYVLYQTHTGLLLRFRNPHV